MNLWSELKKKKISLFIVFSKFTYFTNQSIGHSKGNELVRKSAR